MKTLNYALIFTVLSFLTACNGSKETEQKNDNAQKTDLPSYKVAVENVDYAPFVFTNAQSNLSGFDVELIEAIAEESNFAIEFVSVSFDDIFDLTVSNTVDLAIGGLTENDERKEILLASKPYLKSKIGYLVKENSPEKTASELTKKKISVLKNSYQDNLLTKMGFQNIFRKESTFLTFHAIFSDEVYSTLGEEPIMLYESTFFEENYPVRFIPLNEKTDKLVFYANKEKTELQDKVNAGFDKVIANGKYQQINKKWFGTHAEELAVTD